MLVCYAVTPQSPVQGGRTIIRALALLPAPTGNRRLFPGSLEQSEQFTTPKAFGAPRQCVSPSVRKEAPSPLHHFCTISAPFPAQFLFSALVYESLTTNSPLHGAVSPARAAFKRSPGCLEQSNQSISAPFRQA